MTTSIPDMVTVTEPCFEDVRSSSAEVRVTISERSVGSRSSGTIASMRARLVKLGFEEGDMMLEGVERTSWAFVALLLAIGGPIALVLAGYELLIGLAVGAGSVVLYFALAAIKLGTVTASMRIHCADPSAVGRLLDVVLDMRSADVQSIAWRYDICSTTRSDWVARAIARGNERAARIADALGVRILGVHSFHEEHALPQPASPAIPTPAMAASAPQARGRASSVGESLGASPSSTERAGVTVHIRYRIGPSDE